MQKSVPVFVLLLLLSAVSMAQDKRKLVFIDTVYSTQVEKALVQEGVIKKIVLEEAGDAASLYGYLLSVEQVKTGAKAKGLYLTTQRNINSGTALSSNKKDIAAETFAYLDLAELDELIYFLEQCNGVWDKKTSTNNTQYELETLDNLKFSFSSINQGKSWKYQLKFDNIFFEGSEDLALTSKEVGSLLELIKNARKKLPAL